METFYRLVWLFFCYSFLGWLLETAVAAVRERRYVDRSLLFGPVCVVYGAAGVVISIALCDLTDYLCHGGRVVGRSLAAEADGGPLVGLLRPEMGSGRPHLP